MANNQNKTLDQNGLLYFWKSIWTKITGELGKKVDKVDGKGLSTNDYDGTEKANVATAYTHSQAAHSPADAEKNIIVGVQKNGADVTVDPTTRKVNIAVPTKTSEITNDSGFITLDQVPEGVAAGTKDPKMDGVATVGTSVAYAREDHVHPSDNTKVDKVTGKGLSTNDFTNEEKEKLEGIAVGANNYEHPTHAAKNSGLYKVTVDSEGHVSDATAVVKEDITKLGIPAQDTTYEVATQSANGLMSSGDKTKLDGVEEGANKYVHATHTQAAEGMYKVTVDAEGHVSKAAAIVKDDIVGLGIPAQDTTYNPVTTAANGLMTSTDKAKLDAFGEASTYALKADMVNVYKYSGSVATFEALPTGLGANDGASPVYNVEADNMNYAWNGTSWDSLGSILTFEYISNAEIDAIIASE